MTEKQALKLLAEKKLETMERAETKLKPYLGFFAVFNSENLL
jgi:hypothetical protein